MRSDEEVKQLKIRQEQDAQERDVFYAKIEQLEKQLSEARSELESKEKKAAKEKDQVEKLESGSVIPTAVFHKVLNEFYQSDARYTTQRDLRITVGTLLFLTSWIDCIC